MYHNNKKCYSLNKPSLHISIVPTGLHYVLKLLYLGLHLGRFCNLHESELEKRMDLWITLYTHIQCVYKYTQKSITSLFRSVAAVNTV
jgi:hypothetical protein